MRFIHLLLITPIILHASLLTAQVNEKALDSCILHANRLLDESLLLMRQHYYKKDSIQWDVLATASRSKLSKSDNCNDAFEILKWCFREINERHSFVMTPSKAAVYNGNINSGGTMTEKVYGPIGHELIETDIAYIDVPWISTADPNICTAFADSLQNIIGRFDRQGIRKWIIDLRKNTGGNCWPMLAGLGPLLGNGVYGYFVSSSEKIPFSYKDGKMMQGRQERCVVSFPYQASAREKTIVVLTGNNTSSAGEIVALAFKGMQNVYLYGEPTAGLTTANASYPLSDGSLLVLTVCQEADRTGRICEGKIIPDQRIIANTNSGKDVIKSSAIMFLQIE
jgi:carboxyl-terminal processing protease